jgi:hypothetical protein
MQEISKKHMLVSAVFAFYTKLCIFAPYIKSDEAFIGSQSWGNSPENHEICPRNGH